MEEELLRLAGGPHPEAVAGALSEETAEAMREAIEERGRHDASSRQRTGEAFETSADS